MSDFLNLKKPEGIPKVVAVIYSAALSKRRRAIVCYGDSDIKHHHIAEGESVWNMPVELFQKVGIEGIDRHLEEHLGRAPLDDLCVIKKDGVVKDFIRADPSIDKIEGHELEFYGDVE